MNESKEENEMAHETSEIDYLSAYIDGELSKSEQNRVNNYLARSGEGRLELEKLIHMKSLLAACPPVQAPDDLLDFLEQKAREKMSEMPSPRQRWSWQLPKLWMWSASFAAVTLVVGVWINNHRTPRPIPLDTLLTVHSRIGGEGIHQVLLKSSNYSDKLEQYRAKS